MRLGRVRVKLDAEGNLVNEWRLRLGSFFAGSLGIGCLLKNEPDVSSFTLGVLA